MWREVRGRVGHYSRFQGGSRKGRVVRDGGAGRGGGPVGRLTSKKLNIIL